jgi:signal transduction histidine kinase
MLQLPSGRVIALGRLMLAVLFLCAIWIELGKSAETLPTTVQLTIAYAFFAAAVLVACWNDWWREAKLAGAAHAVDIVLFTLLVLLTDGYSSPYFSFFMFLLLSAAIRWGWRATALTAALVAILYLGASLAALDKSAPVDPEHFLIRAGNLLILSLIVIWFGIQWRPRFSARAQGLLDPRAMSGEPIEASLAAAMAAVRARAGAFAWRKPDRDTLQAAVAHGAEVKKGTVHRPVLLAAHADTPFLYDIEKDRCLWRDSKRSLRVCRAHEAISADAVTSLDLTGGLAVRVRSGAGEGVLFLQNVPGLSTDHLDLGAQIGGELAAAMEQRALVRAAEESSAARTRLALARDLHDSVVQFLAGAAFRLEAVRRAEAAGATVGPEVEELKKLMLEEQGELRSFVSALRSGSRVALDDLAKDLDTLVARLSKQWAIDCAFSSEPGSAMIPTRIHLDAQQLVREAVANAVRHAGARSVRIRLAAANDELLLDFINDGSAYPRSKDGGRMPRSMTERVQEAGGALELSRGMGMTKVSIALPIGART